LRPGVADLSLAPGKPESAKYSLERADLGEAGLKKIHTDERREKQPGRMNEPRKRERSENEDAGEASNDVVIAHMRSPRKSEESFCRHYCNVQALAGTQLGRFVAQRLHQLDRSICRNDAEENGRLAGPCTRAFAPARRS
jgi:hypothetical protein